MKTITSLKKALLAILCLASTSVMAETYTYEFTSKVWSENGAQTLNGVEWNLQTDAGYFGFDTNKKTVLVIGGSLGARTINQTLMTGLPLIKAHPDVQFIWQTGKIYINQVKEAITAFTGESVRSTRVSSLPNLYVTDFIKHMDCAYALADLVISRAGAGSISELCLLGKPCILVPSPNVAEDHQTKNALALVEKRAALYVKDADAKDCLLNVALETLADDEKLLELKTNVNRLARPNAARDIAEEVLRLVDNK